MFQYISCSWDQTIRVWNAWTGPRQKKQHIQRGEKQRLSSSLNPSSTTLTLSGLSLRKSDFGNDSLIGIEVDADDSDLTRES